MAKHKSTLSHIDQNNYPTMVDVANKQVSERIARARSIVLANDEIMAHFSDGEIQSPKGAVFQTAIIAGTMAAKKTADLIPFCHPLPLDSCRIHITVNEKKEIIINCSAKVRAKTGVEMESLTGATVAALTIYDMCKALSHHIYIKEIKLIEKSGGKNDFLMD